jgi:hypothetical protein
MRQGDAAISPPLLSNLVDQNRAQLLGQALEFPCYEVWIYPANHTDNKLLQGLRAIFGQHLIQGLW